jgi:lysine-specific demethylase 8
MVPETLPYGLRESECLGSVDVAQDLSVEAFRRDYMRPRRPVLIQGGFARVPAAQWSEERMRELAGHRRVPVSMRPRSAPGARMTQHVVPFAEVLQHAFSATSETAYYLQSGRVENGRFSLRQGPVQLPELSRDLPLPPYVAEEWFEESNLWVASEGTVARLHYDPSDGLLGLVSGRKHLALFAPSETPHLYPVRSYENVWSLDSALFSRAELANPERYPQLRNARYNVATLLPGDLLYIPTGYWHSVVSTGRNIGANFWWSPPHWKSAWARLPTRRYALRYAMHAPAALATHAARRARAVLG